LWYDPFVMYACSHASRLRKELCMIHIVRINVPTFLPRDAIVRQYWGAVAPRAEEQQELERDERLQQAFFEALWIAFRTYFGALSLPDLAVIEAAKRGNERPYRDWDLSISDEINPELSTGLHSINEESFWFLYLEVDHGDHTDLLLLQESRMELFFRHAADRDDSDMPEGLFRPLVTACERRGLSPAKHDLEVIFVDDQGIHTSPFATFLEQCGLY